MVLSQFSSILEKKISWDPDEQAPGHISNDLKVPM